MLRAIVRTLFAALSFVACTGDAPADGSPGGPGIDAGFGSDAALETSGADGNDASSMDLPSGACDLAAPSACSPGLVCYSWPPSCSGMGRCIPPSSDCFGSGPVCGCDGRVHAEPCDAYAAGTVLAPADMCRAPENRFPCGARFCDPLVEYCQRTVSGDVTTYTRCASLPTSCIPRDGDRGPDCSCWPETGISGYCRTCRVHEGPVRGLEVDCPPPPNAL